MVGAGETVVRALLDVLGPQGTLMAYASWEDHVYHAADWPAEHRDAYLAEPPVFDVATAEAARDHGRIPERVRTWPGARRSAHPEASVVAVGARAAWLTDDHPRDDAYGPDSPFARLVEGAGQVLMLGAPLDTVTLLHHAEAIADAPDKRRVTFAIPVAEQDGIVERTFTDIDTSEPGAFPYERLELGEDAFAVIDPGRSGRRHRCARPRRAGREPPLSRPRTHRLRRGVDRAALRRRRPRRLTGWF